MIEAVYIEHLGSDKSVVNAARVTMGVVREGAMNDRDSGLIRFLAREGHHSPFRHPQVTLRCKAPIAIARQLGKHQVGFTWNEMSRRYKDGGVENYTPVTIFSRPKDLHEGAGGVYHDPEDAANMFDKAYSASVEVYREMLSKGVAPEQARFVLPQGMITEWVWTGSLFGWYNLYKQRSSTHAQWDVRVFANQIDSVMTELFPVSWEALKISD